jgi:ribosomal protein S27AE
MATFLKHEPCPKCGSKDNLGRYDDGSAYCFGCGYTENPNRYTPATNRLSDEPSIRLPEDATTDFTGPGLDWLCSFGITSSERIRYRMLWSPTRQQLIFPLYDKSHKLVAWQGRNFHPAAKSKYFSQGKIHDVLYFCGKKEAPVILVEDLLSAIKIGRIACAMPLWGSEASTPLLVRLKSHTNGVVLWLDSDKWKNSHDIVKRAQSVGLAGLSVFTNKDPKEYDDNYIKYFLTK